MTHPLPVGERKIQIFAKICIEVANIFSLDVSASFKISAFVDAKIAFVDVDARSFDTFESFIAFWVAWWCDFASKAAHSVNANCSIGAGMIVRAFVNIGAANIVGVRCESVMALAVVVDNAVDTFCVFAADAGIKFALVVFDNAVRITVAAVTLVTLAHSSVSALRIRSTFVRAV